MSHAEGSEEHTGEGASRPGVFDTDPNTTRCECQIDIVDQGESREYIRLDILVTRSPTVPNFDLTSSPIVVIE